MKKAIIFGLLLAVVFTGCKKDDENNDNEIPQGDKVEGVWLSSGTDVSPLLAYNGFSSINAEFKADGTYTVIGNLTAGGAINFVGVYEQTKSDVEGIYNIKLIQSAPSSAISEGILQITVENQVRIMVYEVAQVDPSVAGVTAPTAEAGFGSTSDGQYGMMNVQRFVEVQ
ncbi:MAG: hypothetical protein RBT74_14625 [Tenuifilaceae bacterium]|jgi:hypothetical protein|nr:hypothetical protein [Tenuifilaceae bacterium]